MTLDEAVLSFIEQTERTGTASRADKSFRPALELFRKYFPREATIDDITNESLRDFLARWYVEQRATRALREQSGQAENISFEAAAYRELTAALTHFFNRPGEQSKTDFIRALAEFKDSVPRAVAITVRLSNVLAARGGAFNFPEFLTSFEDGGRSEYDIAAPGPIGALDGNFRIARVEGTVVEAEDLNTGERIFPITFPEDVAELLAENYIINLEMTRAKDGWHISSCGFAYPPTADL